MNDELTVARPQPDALDRRLALAGVVSPVLFFGVAIAVAAATPGYSHLVNFLSELGASGAPHADWMNYAGIVPTGLLVAATALPLYRGLGPGALAVVGAAFLLAGGLGLTGAGIFHCDVGCPISGGSLSNDLHLELARFGLLCGSLAPLAFGLGGRRRDAHRSWSTASLLLALVLYALAFAPVDTAYPGARQRAFLGVFFAWLAVSCLRVRGRS
jgi:hypothetical protein